MRISKVVRERIEHEVRVRLETQFAAVKEECKHQTDTRDRVLCDAAKAAEQAWLAVIEPAIAKYPFLKRSTCRGEPIMPNFYGGGAVGLGSDSPVFSWERRLRDKTKAATDNILFQLEMASNKDAMAMLEKLLAELGAEA